MVRYEIASGGHTRVVRYAHLDDEYYLEVGEPPATPLMVVVEGALLRGDSDPRLLVAVLERLGVEIAHEQVPRLKAQALRCRRSTSGTFERPR